MKRRSLIRKILDTLLFPLRAMTLFERDRWGLSSLATERFDYVSSQVTGYCLDVGCGRYNRFINEFRDRNGKGIDVFAYEGLTAENIVEDISKFPFKDSTFENVTFIANINHVPRSLRDIELAESYRCLENSGKIIITMGNPLAEVLVHKLVYFYDKFLGTSFDADNERGMDVEEAYYLKDEEILERLKRAGFKDIKKQYFFTQWGLNHMFIGTKKHYDKN